jgi:hypothetical protein
VISARGDAMNRKRLFCIIPLIFAGVFLFAVPKDLILVLDVSSNMSSYYDNVNGYLTGRFLQDNLEIGDTFHLIAYGSKARLDVARRILGEGDVKTICSRIMLLLPLEPSSNMADAINFSEQYIRSLPSSRKTKIFIVSDSDNGNLVSPAASRFRVNGADLRFLKAPFSAQAAAVNPNSSALFSSTGGTRPTAVIANPPISSGGNVSPGDSIVGPPAIEPPPSDTQENGIGSDDTIEVPPTINPLESFGDPDDTAIEIPPAIPEDTGENQAAQNLRTFFSAIPLPFLIALGLLILLALILIIIFMVRKLQSSPNRVMAAAASVDDTAARNAELLNSFAKTQAAASTGGPHRHHHRDDSNEFMTNPPMLNIFVEEQNTAIGRRNVHTLKSGSVFSVGGRGSDFLIFLVPLPSHIGQLRFDGTNCTFVPLKPKYFPDIGSNQVPECIGKTIRVISDKKYELFFHFERYKDPLIVLNRLLHSLSVPTE